MQWIVIIIIILVLASKFDDATGSSCFTGLLIMGVGIAVTIAAFAFNPILGIIVGYIVLQMWKGSDK